MYDFLSIDVETANESPGSICQIGLAKYKNFQLVDTWDTLIDPEDYFCGLNCAVHGIEPRDVQGAPTFFEIFAELGRQVENHLLLHHTHFSRTAINRACDFNRLETLDWRWLDKARVSRRTWEKFQRSGFGLVNLCSHIGFEFKHHNAKEGAMGAGAVFVEAYRTRGVLPKDWLELVKAPIGSKSSAAGYDHGEGKPDAPLFGEFICFTGTLDSLRRSNAIEMARKAGCTVEARVTRKTSMQGDQDILRARGQKISNKMREAEKYARNGQSIRLLRESNFLELVGERV